MLISNLQEFLRLMLPPLTALGVNAPGQKSLTAGVESLVKALDPFARMTAEDLAEWLKLAATYRDTGQVPELAPTARKGHARGEAKPKVPKEPRPARRSTAEVVESLRALQARDGGLDPAHVKAEVDALDSLTIPQLKEVHKEFLTVVVGKTKAELLAALRKRINDHHATRDRVDGILAQ